MGFRIRWGRGFLIGAHHLRMTEGHQGAFAGPLPPLFFQVERKERKGNAHTPRDEVSPHDGLISHPTCEHRTESHHLSLGEPVLLFLTRSSSEPGVFVVVGMAQGRFRILTGDETGERFVARTLGNIHLVGEVGEDTYSLAEPETCSFLPLDTFLDAVRRIAGQ